MQSPLLPASRKPEQPQYFYSPAFQCYTSPPFYKSLLSELQYVSSFIDICKPQAREIVWRQLFTLIGAKPLMCSKVFGPVLKAWAEAPTINLLAIELLYLSFAISLDNYPDLIKDANAKRIVPDILPHPMRVPSGMKMRMPAPAHQVNHPMQGHSPATTLIRRGSEQHMRRSDGSSVRDLPPMQSPDRNERKEYNPAPRQPSPPSPQQPSTPPQPSISTTSQVDFSKLLLLQSWKESLDAQPSAIRGKIWRVWESLGTENADSYLNKTFSAVLDEWVRDLAKNSEAIFNLHSAVECINNNLNLNLTTGPSNSNRPSSPAPAQNTQHSQHSQHSQRPTLPPPTRTHNTTNSLPPFRTMQSQNGNPFDRSSPFSMPSGVSLRPIANLPQKRPLQPHTLMEPKRMKHDM